MLGGLAEVKHKLRDDDKDRRADGLWNILPSAAAEEVREYGYPDFKLPTWPRWLCDIDLSVRFVLKLGDVCSSCKDATTNTPVANPD